MDEIYYEAKSSACCLWIRMQSSQILLQHHACLIPVFLFILALFFGLFKQIYSANDSIFMLTIHCIKQRGSQTFLILSVNRQYCTLHEEKGSIFHKSTAFLDYDIFHYFYFNVFYALVIKICCLGKDRKPR